MTGRLQPGARATADGFRVAHIVRQVTGGLAHVLCREVTLWSALDRSRLAGDGVPTCRTCARRAEAAARRAVRGAP